MEKKNARITVSLTDRQRSDLEDLAQSMGLEATALIRIAVSGLLDYAEAHGGVLPMPLRFDRAWTDLKSLLDRLEAGQPLPAPRAAEDPAAYPEKSGD